MSNFEQRGIKNQPSGYEQYEHIRLELQGPAAAQEAEIVEGES